MKVFFAILQVFVLFHAICTNKLVFFHACFTFYFGYQGIPFNSAGRTISMVSYTQVAYSINFFFKNHDIIPFQEESLHLTATHLLSEGILNVE